MEAKEKAAWQAFKDKNANAFQKLVDKDVRAVYPEGICRMQNELDDMKKWDMKSFEISDFDMFSDEKDVVVMTYKVKMEGTYDGKDMSGTYNAGTRLETGEWELARHFPHQHHAGIRCRARRAQERIAGVTADDGRARCGAQKIGFPAPTTRYASIVPTSAFEVN